MRRFVVVIETPFCGGEIREEFEVEDDATQEDIDEEAKEIFLNNCNYGCHEVTSEDDE
ncbi:DUF7167 family protein [Serratia odorifera]